jgi:hypothetical protein
MWLLTSHNTPVPTTPYSPGGGTTAHSALTPHNTPVPTTPSHWEVVTKSDSCWCDAAGAVDNTAADTLLPPKTPAAPGLSGWERPLPHLAPIAIAPITFDDDSGGPVQVEVERAAVTTMHVVVRLSPVSEAVAAGGVRVKVTLKAEPAAEYGSPWKVEQRRETSPFRVEPIEPPVRLRVLNPLLNPASPCDSLDDTPR